MFAILEDFADEVEILVLLVPGGRNLSFCCVLQGCHCCYGDTPASKDAKSKLRSV